MDDEDRNSRRTRSTTSRTPKATTGTTRTRGQEKRTGVALMCDANLDRTPLRHLEPGETLGGLLTIEELRDAYNPWAHLSRVVTLTAEQFGIIPVGVLSATIEERGLLVRDAVRWQLRAAGADQPVDV